MLLWVNIVFPHKRKKKEYKTGPKTSSTYFEQIRYFTGALLFLPLVQLSGFL